MPEAFDFHRYGTPREVMREVFSYLGELSIKGGWGYTKEDAVIIDKNDPVVEPGTLFNGVALEYIFIEIATISSSSLSGPKATAMPASNIKETDKSSNRIRSMTGSTIVSCTKSPVFANKTTKRSKTNGKRRYGHRTRVSISTGI